MADDRRERDKPVKVRNMDRMPFGCWIWIALAALALWHLIRLIKW